MSNILISSGDFLKITRPPPWKGGDGAVFYIKIKNTNMGVATNPGNNPLAYYSDTITLDIEKGLNVKKTLDWHNCYSFGNGVESNRITDTFNAGQVMPGVKVSTLFDEYKKEHRKHGLIYSGIYNSTSGVNNLNQFIQAEKITKDINPTYGSIQKLHTRDTDLVTFCEDKVLRILSNKDALYNADGNVNLTATENVLGQAVPFVGEFGISKNPESFVAEAYRSYFTDKQRGAVMRLSRDGLTPISNHGMKDWFRDNLSSGRVNLLGEDSLASQDNWDIPSDGNSAIINGEAILGYYNNDIHDNRYGKGAKLIKEDILEIGKKYRLQYDVIQHGGLQHQDGGNNGIVIMNMPSGSDWIGAGWSSNSKKNGRHINVTWTANITDFILMQFQVNTPSGYYTQESGVIDTVRNYVRAQRIATGWPDGNNDGIPDGNDYPNTSWLYGGTVRIKNLILEEVRVEPKIIGSYDDRQDEYNVTIHSDTSKTVSFREDVKGWVSFKSFFPENAMSCANDYYTIKYGKLWQHHVQGVNNNTFYGDQTNSSLNVIFNDAPSSVKSFHALDYEGSQSRVEGIRTVKVIGVNPVYKASGAVFYTSNIGKYFVFTKEEMLGIFPQYELSLSNPLLEIKQYRNNILIFQGEIEINGSWSYPNPHGRKASGDDTGDFQIGDIITTEEQEKTVNHFNSMPKDGWWVSNIETDKQKGSLPEFIEKEGKWFNYIKGIDSDIDETTNFGSFDIQGIGIANSVDSFQGNIITFTDNINSSLQIGDTLYFERPSEVLGELMNLTNGITTNGFAHHQVSGAIEAYPATSGGIATKLFNIKQNATYLVTFEVVNYVQGEFRAVLVHENSWGSGGNITGPGRFEQKITVNTPIPPPPITSFYQTNSLVFESLNDLNCTIENISIQEVKTGEIFGFTRLEANNLQKCGIVTGLTNNTVTIDNSGTLPAPQDYILFAKNQVVNTSSLMGYYANVKIENNSKRKAEIFSLSSEITESSK